MTTNTSDRKSVSFRANVPAGETRTLTYGVQRDATVEQVDVRIYTGPRLDLHVEPFVEIGGQGDGRSDRVPLVELVGKDFIDGDGDLFTFYPTESVEGTTDVVGVEIENVDDQYGYDAAIDVMLDREGGTERASTSFLGRFL